MGYPELQTEWGTEHPAAAAARMARTNVLFALLKGEIDGAAWVIDSDPDVRMSAQYERVHADVVRLDPGRAICLERAKATRSESTVLAIEAWFDARQDRIDRGRPGALDAFG